MVFKKYSRNCLLRIDSEDVAKQALILPQILLSLVTVKSVIISSCFVPLASYLKCMFPLLLEPDVFNYMLWHWLYGYQSPVCD